MNLKIPFDEIKDSIEMASFDRHYVIDLKNHEMIFISDYDDDYEKRLEKADSDNFITIPSRMHEDDYKIMESFAYEMQDINSMMAEKLHTSLAQKKPFRNFKRLIGRYSTLMDKWNAYRDKELENEAMNWLCTNSIELEDKSFMPEITIKELRGEELKLPEGFEGFGPVACMKCNTKDGLKARYFETSHCAENMLFENEIKRIMKEKFNLERYGCISGGSKEILIASECSKCKSNEIFEDFT